MVGREGARRVLRGRDQAGHSKKAKDQMKTQIVVLLLLASAATVSAQTPGKVTVTTSKLDGERHVHVEPGFRTRFTAISDCHGH